MDGDVVRAAGRRRVHARCVVVQGLQAVEVQGLEGALRYAIDEKASISPNVPVNC
ncbi:MAG: hypothetical protein ACRDRK_02855 [Pseudonocardia sp.]